MYLIFLRYRASLPVIQALYTLLLNQFVITFMVSISITQVLRNYEDFVSSKMAGKVFADNTGCVGWYR